MEELTEYVVTFCDITTVGFCVFCKLPQIWKLFRTKDAEGLSTSSLALEIITYAISLCYHVMMGYPLLSFLEDPFLVTQSSIVLLLVYYYTDSLNLLKIGAFGAAGAVFYALTLGYPHPSALPVLLSATLPMKVASKLLQIKEIWVKQTAGNISLFSWFINVYTCATRIVTTLLVTEDNTLLIKHCLSLFLNCLVIASAWRFSSVKQHKRIVIEDDNLPEEQGKKKKRKKSKRNKKKNE